MFALQDGRRSEIQKEFGARTERRGRGRQGMDMRSTGVPIG